jgi:uncharacterized membrane protein YGL010W
MRTTRTREEWLTEYGASHQHPVNRFCHTLGIPMIALSLVVLVFGFWRVAIGLYLVGWIFQFVGHAVEGKRPEFLRDWRFFLVGLLWWSRKIRGRA